MQTKISITPGAGGQESLDFASMLFKMYSNWARRHGIFAGSEDGHTSLEVKMSPAELAQEHGIHRLCRSSPFDEKGRRHTSFASVKIHGIESVYNGAVRSYVIDPYQQARDERKNFTTKEVLDVLNGGDEFDRMRASEKITFETHGGHAFIEHRTLTQEEKDYALTLTPTIENQ